MKVKKLRIVQAIASKGWGGRETVPLHLGEEFRRRGHEVALWTDPGTPLGKKAKSLGFPISSLKYRSHLDPRGYFEAGRALETDRPDILHVHHSRDLWTLVPALKAKGWKGPLVLSKHVESAVQKKDPLHRLLYDRVDLVLACSTMVQQNVASTCPIDPTRIKVGYAPVDIQIFKPSPQGRRKVRKVWGVDRDPVVGMVARLSPGKGHELILQAAALLKNKFPRLRFKMAGGTHPKEVKYGEALLRLRDSLGLKGSFDFEGYVENVPSFLSALDLVVHAAPAESFGMAIVEAMACGLPVLARRGGGVADIFQAPGGKVWGGKMIDSDDPKVWAEGIARFLHSPAALRTLAANSRKNAQRFSLKTFADEHLDRYQALLEKKGPSQGQP